MADTPLDAQLVNIPQSDDPDPPRQPHERITRKQLLRVLNLAGQDIKQMDIARITGISQPMISLILSEADDSRKEALHVLHANQARAAHKWVGSFDKAERKGDHRPMKDLLIATGAVQPDPQAVGVTIIIGNAEQNVRKERLPAILALPGDISLLPPSMGVSQDIDTTPGPLDQAKVEGENEP